MNLIKLSINQIMQKKCLNCKDKSICKLKTYYESTENLTIKDLEKITGCIFYKKQLPSVKIQNKIS